MAEEGYLVGYTREVQMRSGGRKESGMRRMGGDGRKVEARWMGGMGKRQDGGAR